MVTLRRARVLIVERDDALRRSTAEVVATGGHDVREAADSSSALAMALTFRPDIALVHVGLADAWSLVRALRADPSTRACAIIATGGSPVAAHVREPGLREVEAYLLKPADPAFLLAVVTGALKGGGVAERASREWPVVDGDGTADGPG